MDQIRLTLTNEQAAPPAPSFAPRNQPERDVVLLMVRRELARQRFGQRRAASRRGRQFEKRALATTPRW